ncbi:MAG: nickel pincer cofactor biosynthesis protein LarB [Peptoniphilaceae bacterium]|nr:nickel pincer cofactor biosynthesis protein LarB [Peptoniphilaceae bacterium]MDD7383268.1 nickel pincer cofactor biosynthesis protein LarB [Peptoniphilaceae bacterium]MDY3737975.1 nickel pincer cofactor biosynthesis protein LarB [Peptoniphilaceae bacterium]
MDEKNFLENIKNGEISINDGIKYLKDFNYKEMNFAKLDFQRKSRRHFGEVIFGENKKIEHIIEIINSFIERKEDVLITRLSKKRAKKILKSIPSLNYDPLSQTGFIKFSKNEQIGNVAICTGGTADMKIAEEARITAEFFGCKTNKFYDVGVSGIHRVFSKMDEIKKANAIIAIAGMEGALPTVLAGLVDRPIIAVPTSVGYGASLKGISALLTMINSCAEGISVVNIDNGYGAAYNAAQINFLVEGKL